MKRLLIASLVCLTTALFADTWTDPETEITWTYKISNGEAHLSNSSGGYSVSVIPTNTAGNIIIPKTLGGCPVTYIGSGAFEGCVAISTIEIPTSVTKIGSYAFDGCSALYSIIISNNVTSIGSYAFRNCLALKKLHLPNISRIYEYTFSECTSLKSITIPESVKTIDNYAFSGRKVVAVTFMGLPPSVGYQTSWAFSEINYISNPIEWSAHKALCESLKAQYKYSEDPTPNLPVDVPWRYVGGEVKILTIFDGGSTETTTSTHKHGDVVSVTATPKEGYVFLGWSSDAEGIGGNETTLTFTMPEVEEIVLIANFFPKALLTSWINDTMDATLEAKVESTVNAKIDGEKLLTAEQSAAKTTTTIKTKVAAGELITSDQLQEMALSEPVIEVKEGAATVGISVMKTSSVDGEWEAVELEANATTVESDKIQVSLPADEKAAFYKFVAPEKQ